MCLRYLYSIEVSEAESLPSSPHVAAATMMILFQLNVEK